MSTVNHSELQRLSDAEFLALLERRGVELRLHGGKLRISAPAGAIDDDLKPELVARKAMLLSYCEESSDAPLSYAQERLWLLEQFQPGNFAYNVPETADIRVNVDAGILQRAIDRVVERHETLRTDVQQNLRGTAFQRVHASLKIPLQTLDYSLIEAARREKHLQQTLRTLTRLPFDLRSAPLVRFYLIRMEPDRYVVFINIHHIISDRWSMRILVRELLSAYNAFATGQQPQLSELTIQYREFARRERRPSTPEVRGQLEYWKRKLADLPEPSSLPFELHPAVPAPFEGAIHEITFLPDDTEAVRSLARARNVSPYILLLAAYVALLHRFTGLTDVCVGSPVSNRHSTQTESLIGFFVNTLVMRCSVTGDMSFADLLHGVRETVLEAQSNQDVPLQKILSEMRSNFRIANAPIFQTMMGFDSYVRDVVAAESSSIPLDPGSAKFDLTLQMYESKERIGGYIEYRTDLFASAAIRRFADAFVLLLRDAVHAPQKTIASLHLVTPEERDRLVRKWNQTEMDFPRDRAIHHLFEAQAAATPDATVLVDGEDRISYGDLNRMANRIAHSILKRTPASGTQRIVGVHLERSAGMVASMLGILKAGAAYLPMDTQYPEERLRFMLDDSGAHLILSESWIDKNFPAGPTVLPAGGRGSDKPEFDQNLDLPVSPQALAYVIYTSGSTGKPKGVAIEHHSTVSFLTWGKNTFSTDDLRGTLASTSICFDLSVFEIFLPLITGGTVILARDVLGLPNLPAASEVTLVTTVPSAITALLDQGRIPHTVRTLNSAGEPLSAHLVDRLYAETGIAAVNDLYGPTETTTYSTWTRRTAGTTANIGRPLGNTRVYLVDRDLQLVPQGMPGELLIAGEGVARGYLGRPELTAEKFVTLEHLDEPGRAYRTGDLCSFNDDGSLVYLGRMDQQVKIRGYRIEIGEVEAALRDHPTIEEAVVFLQTSEDGSPSLVGALRLKAGHPLDAAVLIAHQATLLPSYMAARRLFAVADFPRTANGKIDRKKLATMAVPSETGRVTALPRNAVEKELVAIWQEGFHLKQIGIDDDFFQMGGHSLLALRLFAEIEARLGCRMMLSILFQAPTIRLLSEHVQARKLA
jgi:amino acid adenylation domain-containing protein